MYSQKKMKKRNDLYPQKFSSSKMSFFTIPTGKLFSVISVSVSSGEKPMPSSVQRAVGKQRPPHSWRVSTIHRLESFSLPDKIYVHTLRRSVPKRSDSSSKNPFFFPERYVIIFFIAIKNMGMLLKKSSTISLRRRDYPDSCLDSNDDLTLVS